MGPTKAANLNFWLSRIDADGQQLWHTTVPAPTGSYWFALTPLADGGLASVGLWSGSTGV